MIFLAARTLESVMTELIFYVIMAVPPILFALFLTLFIVNLVKTIKKKQKATKAIVFGCISVVFLLISLVEAFFMIMLSLFVASM